MRLISAILIGNIILLQANDASTAPSSIECILKPIDIIEDTGFEFPGPIRALQYSEPTPIDGLDPVGGLAFGNENANYESYAADLNGDQRLDIITHLSPGLRSTAPPSPIQILFNTGEGGLVDCTEELVVGDTPTMEFVRNILVDDFNGDGKMDIFFSNTGKEYQDPFPCEQNRLLLSDSEGKLRDVTSTHLPQLVDFSHGSSAADVDLDGDIDIFVANLGCVSTIGSYLMKNNGSGQFTIVAGGEPFVHAYFSYQGPTWSAFVDFDKDGDPDLFAATATLLSESNEEQFVNVVLVNDGLGNFDIKQSVLLPPPVSQCPGEDYLNGAQDISVDDINHDGWSDIVLYYAACDSPIVQLLINSKAGGFNDETEQRIPSHETASFGNPRFMVADVDGNRSPDIIFEQHQEDFSITPYYFLNDGTGHFTRDNPMLDWAFGSQLIMVDLNGDGVMDQVDTPCESWGENGCLSSSWYKRIIQALPNPEPGFQINAGHSGAWYNPESSGQGALIDILPASQFLFLSWFTFTAGAHGEPGEPHWFTAQGNYSANTADLVVYETTGGQFDDPRAVKIQAIGAASLVFSDCAHGLLHYKLDNWDRQGSIRLQRAIPGSENVCEQITAADGETEVTTQAQDINAGMDGAWYKPATSGQGLLVDVHPDPNGDDFIFMAWFTFGDATSSGLRWLTGQGGYAGATADLELFETTGGLFDDSRMTETVKVGSATIEFTDCKSARLNYSLEDEDRSGEIELIRAIPGGEGLCEKMAGAD